MDSCPAGQRDGPRSLDALFETLQAALRAEAARRFADERRDHTLQPTALVNEVYLRLADQTRRDWRGRTHFLAVAAGTMRQILIDHARGKGAAKRGGGRARVTLDDALGLSRDGGVDLLSLTEAMDALSDRDPRAGRIVELRFFGGLTEKEVGEVVGLSDRAVRKEWAWARAWLRCRLNGEARHGH